MPEPPPPDAAPHEPRAGLGRLIAFNASALMVGRFVSAGLGIIGVGITSRYLGLNAYATLVTVTVFTVMLTPLVEMGVWTIGARELAKRPAETRRLMGSMFTISIALQLLTATIGLTVAWLIYSGPGGRLERETIALLMLVPLPIAAVAAPASAYLVAVQRGFAAAVASVAASVAMTLLLVLAVVFDLGFTTVVIANIAQSVVFGAVILAYALPRVRFRPSWDPALSRQLLVWALPLGVVAILTSLYWRIDIVVLSIAGSQRDVGIYGLAYKVVDALYILPTMVMVTLLPELARLAENGERRDELVRKVSAVMQVAVVPLLVLTVAFAGEIVALAGGEAFEGAAVILRILMLGVAVGFLRAVFTEALIAANRQLWLMYATGALLAINVALNLALIPVWGARGSALAFVASEAVALVLVLVLFGRVGAAPAPQRLPRVLLAGGAMGAVTLLQHVPVVDSTGPVAVLVVLGSLSIAAYAACLHALRAVPPELHTAIVAPLLARMRARSGPA